MHRHPAQTKHVINAGANVISRSILPAGYLVLCHRYLAPRLGEVEGVGKCARNVLIADRCVYECVFVCFGGRGSTTNVARVRIRFRA